ncbi:hypothetical protein MMC11_003606 [Xylographa trunciseda]|nr:hypothetical protein [Xylographa trunciseda]
MTTQNDFARVESNSTAVDTALKGWSPTDRTAFLKWFLASGMKDRQDVVSKQKEQPVLKSPQYIKALQAIDFGDRASIGKFMSLTQIRDCQPPPQPISLGLDNSFRYYLNSQLGYLEITDKLPEGTDGHDELIEFKAQDGKPPPLQYALHLGVLEAIPARKNYADVDKIKTPFRVWIDAVAKSIWLVLDRNATNELGDPAPIDPRDDPWNYLPTPRNSRQTFDVMQVLTSDEIGRIDDNRPLFGAASLLTTQVRHLQPYTVAKDVIGKKIPKSSGPTAGGSGPTAGG